VQTVNPAEFLVIAWAGNCKVCILLVGYAIWAPSTSGGFHLCSSARKEMVTTYKRTARHVCLDRVENNKVDLLGYITLLFHCGFTWWRSWLRQCATSRKVASSFPDGVIGPGVDSASNRIKYFMWRGGGERHPVRRADNLTDDCLEVLGSSTS